MCIKFVNGGYFPPFCRLCFEIETFITKPHFVTLIGKLTCSDVRMGDNRKGATAPNTPLRASDLDDVPPQYNIGYQQSTYSAGKHTADFLSLSTGDSRYSRRPGSSTRSNPDGSLYEAYSSTGNRNRSHKSGYHSAGESYHYVTDRRGSDYGAEDTDAGLYLTDVEARRRRTTSRSSYEGWDSRYSERLAEIDYFQRKILDIGKMQKCKNLKKWYSSPQIDIIKKHVKKDQIILFW